MQDLEDTHTHTHTHTSMCLLSSQTSALCTICISGEPLCCDSELFHRDTVQAGTKCHLPSGWEVEDGRAAESSTEYLTHTFTSAKRIPYVSISLAFFKNRLTASCGFIPLGGVEVMVEGV